MRDYDYDGPTLYDFGMQTMNVLCGWTLGSFGYFDC